MARCSRRRNWVSRRIMTGAYSRLWSPNTGCGGGERILQSADVRFIGQIADDHHANDTAARDLGFGNPARAVVSDGIDDLLICAGGGGLIPGVLHAEVDDSQVGLNDKFIRARLPYPIRKPSSEAKLTVNVVF